MAIPPSEKSDGVFFTFHILKLLSLQIELYKKQKLYGR